MVKLPVELIATLENTGRSFEITIIFHPRAKELNVLGKGEHITYRCQLTDKKQYICNNPVND